MTAEQKLLNELKKRKSGSIEKAIEMYTPYINVIVYSIIGSAMTKEDIEEVISDAFIVLWKNAETLDTQKGSVRTYLGTVSKNLAKNKLRKLSFCEEMEENTVFTSETPESSFELKEKNQALTDLIALLGEPDNEIFIRYYYYEERIRTISKAMDIPSSTIKSKLARGRKKLKKIIEEGDLL